MISKMGLKQSVLTAMCTLAMACTSHATLCWDPAQTGSGAGSGGNGNWDMTSSYWYPGTGVVDQVWASGADAYFGGAVGTVTLTAPVTAGSLTFIQTNYNVNGSTLTLANSGIINVDIATNQFATLNAVVAGTNGLIKNGRGVLTLANQFNSYNGPTILNLGSLYFYQVGRITNSTSMTINPGANLFLESQHSTISGHIGCVPVDMNSGWIRLSGALSAYSAHDIRSLNIGPGFSVVYFHSDPGYDWLGTSNLTTSAGAAFGLYGTITDGACDMGVTNATGFIGGGFQTGTKSSILPFAVWARDVQNYAFSEFLTYEPSRTRFRYTSWADGSYLSSIADGTTNADNIRISSPQTVNSPSTINSLIFDGCSYNPGSTADITGTGPLTINSGAILLMRAPEHFSNPVVFPHGIEGHIFVANDRATDRGYVTFSPVIRAAISGDSGLTITAQPFYPYRDSVSGNSLQDVPHNPIFDPDPVILSGTSTYTGSTDINAARVVVFQPSNFGNSTSIVVNFGGTLASSNDNFTSASQSLTLNPGAVLDAAGFSTTISNLTFNPGYLGVACTNGILTVAGTLACKDNGQPRAGILPVTGNLTINGAFQADLGGTTPGNGLGFHTQLRINGNNVAIGGNAALSLILNSAPLPGSQYTIISNIGSQAISGTFAGVPQGGTLQGSYGGTNYSFTASYTGGDGNDMVLTFAGSGGGSNQPPTVSITSPANNAGYTTPATITINATASDSDGTVTSVDFYQDTTLLATDTNAPYSYTWNSVPAGGYTLTAKATDNSGASTVSTPVNVDVELLGSSLPLYAVNCGGGAVSPFATDQYYSGGGTWPTSSGIDLTGVTNAAPMAVYQTTRYAPDLGYIFPTNQLVTSGVVYRVRLHFAEVFYTSTSQRVFNIFVNGAEVRTNFDIVQSAGAANKATIVDCNSVLADANGISVWLHATVDQASINGIEVYGIGTGGDTSPKGVPYAWYYGYGVTSNFALADLSDADGDSMKSWEEFYAGTDPTNTSSVFAFLPGSLAPGTGLKWYGTANEWSMTKYRVYRCTNLTAGGWQLVASNLTRSATGTNTWIDPGSFQKAFYRVTAPTQ
jgi:autotransporter-associated beta strand protein